MENQSQKFYLSDKHKAALAGASAVTILGTTQAAMAQTTPVEDVNAMVTSIGSITAGVVGVVVGAMTVRLAVKQVNRLMTKG
jgi:hypothetical protein